MELLKFLFYSWGLSVWETNKQTPPTYGPYHIAIRNMRTKSYDIHADSRHFFCIRCRIFAWVCYLGTVRRNVLNEWRPQGTLCHGHSSAWGGMHYTAYSVMHHTHTYGVVVLPLLRCCGRWYCGLTEPSPLSQFLNTQSLPQTKHRSKLHIGEMSLDAVMCSTTIEEQLSP